MSTKYPTDFDDATTLGPTKVDVIPPADPARNIAAEYRNNTDDALVAVQTRVGKLDDPAVTSVDWGLLTVSGVPNQGVRMAGSHAVWPGLQAEGGIFIDSGTGNVSYHKAGDPVGTFTDLAATGINSWDGLYALDQALDINASPLTYTQTATTDYGFVVDRDQAVADSPILHVENKNASDTEGAALVTCAASGPALEVLQNNSSGHGVKVTSDCNSSSGSALYITTFNSSLTEGNRYTLMLSSVRPVRMYLDPATYVTQHTLDAGTYEPDFFYNITDDSAPVSIYWQCTETGSNSYDKRLAIPLPLPNRAVLKSVQVWGYWGGGVLPGVIGQRPRLELLEKDTGVGSSVTVLSTAYASDMGVNTITLSGSFNIDRTGHSYSLRFRTATANTTGVPFLYAALMNYEMDDLGAAIGTNG